MSTPERLIQTIREILWVEETAEGQFILNPDKEWGVETIEEVALEMARNGHRPERKMAYLPGWPE